METTTQSNSRSTTISYDDNQYQVDVSSTSFELETIISTYTGLMRINRLFYVAEHCSGLKNDALLAVAKFLQETHFASLFKQVKRAKLTDLISIRLDLGCGRVKKE